MNDKEKRIKEQRLIDATHRGLTGSDSKILVILKYLGTPIITNTTGFYTQNELDDPYAEEENNGGLPTIDYDSEPIGQIFDGLSIGFHIEMSYKEGKLLVSYQGYPVYCEVEGELERYVPNKEWEKCIELLYTMALKKMPATKKKEMEQEEEEIKHEKKSLLQRIRDYWGTE